MAESFGLSEEFLEDELSNFIVLGNIIKICIVKKILLAKDNILFLYINLLLVVLINCMSNNLRNV